jgi:peptide/nickel transport system permease protein
VATVFSQIGISTPKFWLATLLVILFSISLDWLPALGYSGLGEGLGKWFAHLVLPAITMGVGSAAIQTRFIRSAVLEVLSKDYVRTARSKGLRESRVIFLHALRNAMISIVTIIGLQMASMISIAVVVEIVFAWPGLGRLALQAVLDRDYTLLRSSIAVIAALVALINLSVDCLYFFLDPRIEFE